MTKPKKIPELLAELKYPITSLDAANAWNVDTHLGYQRLYYGEVQGLLICSDKRGSGKLYSPSQELLDRWEELRHDADL